MTNTALIEKTFSKEINDLLATIEEKVITGYTLADAIREGASVTNQANKSYGRSGHACALTAAAIAAHARGYI